MSTDTITLHPRMPAREIDELVGRTVAYEVIREGRSVPRSGVIGRIDSQFVWISGWLYWLNEPRNLRLTEPARRKA